MAVYPRSLLSTAMITSNCSPHAPPPKIKTTGNNILPLVSDSVCSRNFCMHIKTQIIRLWEDEMDKACGIYRGEQKCMHGFGGEI